jgi:uridine phosphorylase
MAFKVPPNLVPEITKVVAATRFRAKSRIISNIIVGAIRQAEIHQRNPLHTYQSKKATKDNFGTWRKKGRRSFNLESHLICAALWRSWVLGFREIPVINNKGYNDTKFMIFAMDVFGVVKVGKVRDRLESYQSYRKKGLELFEVVSTC